jgi:hypothetical protein
MVVATCPCGASVEVDGLAPDRRAEWAKAVKFISDHRACVEEQRRERRFADA